MKLHKFDRYRHIVTRHCGWQVVHQLRRSDKRLLNSTCFLHDCDQLFKLVLVHTEIKFGYQIVCTALLVFTAIRLQIELASDSGVCHGLGIIIHYCRSAPRSPPAPRRAGKSTGDGLAHSVDSGAAGLGTLWQ